MKEPRMKSADQDRALQILNTLISEGHVVIFDNGVVQGQASDGITVDLGQIPSYPPAATKSGREALYRYLLRHSTPDTW